MLPILILQNLGPAGGSSTDLGTLRRRMARLRVRVTRQRAQALMQTVIASAPGSRFTGGAALGTAGNSAGATPGGRNRQAASRFRRTRRRR